MPFENGLIASANEIYSVFARRKSEFYLVANVVARRAVKHYEFLLFVVVDYGRIQHAPFFPFVFGVRF